MIYRYIVTQGATEIKAAVFKNKKINEQKFTSDWFYDIRLIFGLSLKKIIFTILYYITVQLNIISDNY